MILTAFLITCFCFNYTLKYNSQIHNILIQLVFIALWVSDNLVLTDLLSMTLIRIIGGLMLINVFNNNEDSHYKLSNIINALIIIMYFNEFIN